MLVKLPDGTHRPIEATDWHYKPKGIKGPCPLCGIAVKRLRAEHRIRPDGKYEKVIKVSFGGDFSIEEI